MLPIRRGQQICTVRAPTRLLRFPCVYLFRHSIIDDHSRPTALFNVQTYWYKRLLLTDLGRSPRLATSPKSFGCHAPKPCPSSKYPTQELNPHTTVRSRMLQSVELMGYKSLQTDLNRHQMLTKQLPYHWAIEAYDAILMTSSTIVPFPSGLTSQHSHLISFRREHLISSWYI